MKNSEVGKTTIIIISVCVLIFTNVLTCVLLISKNEEWKIALKNEKDSIIDPKLAASALSDHVYYDGDTIPSQQILSHYLCSGLLVGREKICDVLRGDKIVMFFSPNCCSSCVEEEIKRLKTLAKKVGKENVVFVADFPIHTYPAWNSCFGKSGYYETSLSFLGLRGAPTQETPVVMLVQNGRVKTSLAAGNMTGFFSNGFHEYLVEYFKEKK